MPTDDAGKLITTVDRATDVLMLFTRTRQPTLGVTEIAQRLSLSKAVVHRLLTTLAVKGFVQLDQETHRYALGPTVLSLGLAYLERIDLRRLAQPALHELSAAMNETSTLSIRSGWTRVYVDQVTPPREVRMSVPLGEPFPLHAGSSSKAILAFLEEEEQEAYLTDGPLERLTDKTITDPDQLRRELARIRRRGYAASLGERQAGAASVAAPVLDHRGRPVGSVTVCGPIERFKRQTDDAAARLTEATAALSHQLGFERSA